MRNRLALLLVATALCAPIASSSARESRAERTARAEAKAEAELVKATAGRIAGKPVHCLSPSSVTSSRIVDGTAIIYEAGSRLYVNRPRHGCPSLREGRVLVTRIFGGQLCSGEIVRMIEPPSWIEFGACSLGDFVPYTKPRKG